MQHLTKVANMLGDLPKRVLAPLFREAAIQNLSAEKVLFSAGEPGEGCYRLEHGLVKVGVVSPKGGERIVAILGPGAIVGELSMIDGLPRSASVTTLKDCVFRFVSRKTFSDFAKAHPEIYYQIVMILAGRLREADKALAAATFLSAKGRVARALLEVAEHLGEDTINGRIVLKRSLGQADIAALAGVVRENVSRAMSEWEKKKVITRSPTYYCIRDVAALRSEMEFET